MLGSRKQRTVDSLVGQGTEITGNITFSGGLHVIGSIKGNVYAEKGSKSILIVSEEGQIEGEVRVPDIILNGRVKGDVYGSEHIELAPNAKVEGNVYYNLIEMAIGAEVNGNMVHSKEKAETLALEHQKGSAAEE